MKLETTAHLLGQFIVDTGGSGNISAEAFQVEV
jgi:hypothetical protein